jgi:site-specific recombinase XerD
MPPKKYQISKKNQNEINQFLDSLNAKGSPDDDTIRNYETSIRKILFLIDKPREKITPTDLDKVFSSIKNAGTKELNKMKFKAYLNFWKMNEVANHIKINSSYFRNPRKNANDVLTSEEIEQIRNSSNTNRDLAIFELFVVSGICREELSLLLNRNIAILQDDIRVEIVEGKTPNRPRTVHIIPYPNNPCAFYPNQFVSYYRNHPFKDKADFPLFFSTDYRKPNQPFECHAINQIIHKIRKKAGVTKNVTPHILRHTCATYDGYHNNESFLQTKFGWKNPDMARTYCHLREEQVYDVLKHKAGLTPQFVEIESTCPYCGHLNNINDINCSNCKRTINKEEMAKQLRAQHEREEIIKNGFEMQINELRKELKVTELLSMFFSGGYPLKIVLSHKGKPVEQPSVFLKHNDELYKKGIEDFLINAIRRFDETTIVAFKSRLHEMGITL